jgi:hypothetical protein
MDNFSFRSSTSIFVLKIGNLKCLAFDICQPSRITLVNMVTSGYWRDRSNGGFVGAGITSPEATASQTVRIAGGFANIHTNSLGTVTAGGGDSK